MSRFLHSHSMHGAFDRCKAQFLLLQEGASKTHNPESFLFGRTFHKFSELYRNHCIASKRWSDVEIVGELVDEAFRVTGCSTRHYEEMSLLARQFVGNERIDIEKSLGRETGIALDDSFRRIPWSEDFEYDSPTFRAAGSRAAVRMALDEVLIDPMPKILYVDDWKSDYYVPSQSEISDPSSRWWKQAMEYAWGALNFLYPGAQIVIVRFKFVRWNIVRTMHVSIEEIHAFGELFARKVAFIDGTQDFRATPGAHCRLCPFLGGACPIPNDSAAYESDIEEIAARYLYDDAIRDDRREALKEYASTEGTIYVGGLPVAIFEKSERKVLDVAKILAALRELEIENPELLLDASKTKLQRALPKEIFEAVMDAAGSEHPEGSVVFNVHQNKPELVALATDLGIPNPEKMKVAELALAIVRATSRKAA